MNNIAQVKMCYYIQLEWLSDVNTEMPTLDRAFVLLTL